MAPSASCAQALFLHNFCLVAFHSRKFILFMAWFIAALWLSLGGLAGCAERRLARPEVISPQPASAAGPSSSQTLRNPVLRLPQKSPLSNLPQPGQSALVSEDVRCADEASCPTTVAVMRTSIGKERQFCTSFVVGAHLMMSARHCLGSLPPSGRSCSHVSFHFPSSRSQGLPALTASCEEIVDSSPIDPWGADENSAPLVRDYLVMKTKEDLSARRFLPLNQSGVPDQTPLTVAVLNWRQRQEKLSFRIESRQCLSHQGSYLLASYNLDLSPLVTLIGCLIENGNSGAPVLDNSGQVRAIVKAIGRDGLTGYSYGLATNLACVSSALAELKLQSPSLCRSDERNDPNALEQEQKSRLLKETPKALAHQQDSETKFNAWLENNSQDFDFDLIENYRQLTLSEKEAQPIEGQERQYIPFLEVREFIALPKCFKKDWPANKKIAKLKLPVYSQQFLLDSKTFKISARGLPDREVQLAYELTPRSKFGPTIAIKFFSPTSPSDLPEPLEQLKPLKRCQQ